MLAKCRDEWSDAGDCIWDFVEIHFEGWLLSVLTRHSVPAYYVQSSRSLAVQVMFFHPFGCSAYAAMNFEAERSALDVAEQTNVGANYLCGDYIS